MPEICIVYKRGYSVVMKQFPYPTASRAASGVSTCGCVWVFMLLQVGH